MVGGNHLRALRQRSDEPGQVTKLFDYLRTHSLSVAGSRVKVVPSGDQPSDREDEPKPKRRREDGPGLLNRLPKWILVSIIGISWTALAGVGGVVLFAGQKWASGLEAAVAQSNADAQSQVLQRLTATEAEVRALKDANALRMKADERRDRQIDSILEGMSKLTNRLDVYIAIHDRQAKGGG